MQGEHTLSMPPLVVEACREGTSGQAVAFCLKPKPLTVHETRVNSNPPASRRIARAPASGAYRLERQQTLHGEIAIDGGRAPTGRRGGDPLRQHRWVQPDGQTSAVPEALGIFRPVADTIPVRRGWLVAHKLRVPMTAGLAHHVWAFEGVLGLMAPERLLH